ncbi:hypothetical protein, partial [Mesorhizobium sp.]|uniref:hypothetical protein n=1 Tax=Mesorhizobium sp. TaxID=1871066 RepID=UPI002580BE63
CIRVRASLEYPPILLQCLENGDIDPVERHCSCFLRIERILAQGIAIAAPGNNRIRKHLPRYLWFYGPPPQNQKFEEERTRVGCPREIKNHEYRVGLT